ncbi:MAG: DUF423 domain-containing protein [Akkermansiaceae bacterium]|jgi:uncharacterized membrane protein YgdD (TMEM256/DUF423 family)|nr:DUF423 domain-containing protein [Akkermansiaceae bacterium]
MKSRPLAAAAALSAALSVGLGALAAHALHDFLKKAGHVDSFDTAVLYHLTHSIAALVLAQAGLTRAGWTMLAGVLLFSGSIYLLCLLENVSFLGPVTPVGGVLIIASWIAAAVAFLKSKAV